MKYTVRKWLRNSAKTEPMKCLLKSLSVKRRSGTNPEKNMEEIVRTDEKKRYSFNGDKTLIRANQGHSIQVDSGTAWKIRGSKPDLQTSEFEQISYNRAVERCGTSGYLDRKAGTAAFGFIGTMDRTY